MKKKYDLPEENPENNMVREPMAEYQRATDMKFSPPLTDEELKNAITGDDFWGDILDYVDELYGKK